MTKLMGIIKSENKLTGSLGVRNEINVDIIGTGARGKEGKSAYEIWLDLGNEGTIEDYLSSLQGFKKYSQILVSEEYATKVWESPEKTLHSYPKILSDNNLIVRRGNSLVKKDTRTMEDIWENSECILSGKVRELNGNLYCPTDNGLYVVDSEAGTTLDMIADTASCRGSDIDSIGNIYVLTSAKLKKFDIDWNMVWEIDTELGTSIVIDNYNNIYISEYSGSNGIRKFDVGGNEIWNFGNRFVDVVLDNANNLIGAKAISSPGIYTLTKGGVEVFRNGAVAGNYSAGSTLCVDKNNNVYATNFGTNDEVSYVHKLSPSLGVMLSIPVGIRLNGVAIDNNGNIYIGRSTSAINTLVKYSLRRDILEIG